MTLYGVEQTVTFKDFLATYRPVGGVIRVVIVKLSEQLFADNPVELLGPVPAYACFINSCRTQKTRMERVQRIRSMRVRVCRQALLRGLSPS